MTDDSAISDPRIGTLVDGRYQIVAAMASGSMGAVYKAERVPVGKLVAIKFLHASYAKDAEFLSRFERETRVMSKLAHPNCVSVVDFGVSDGAPYLVMEYVAGTTLRSMIDDAPLAPMRALAIVRQIAAGLAHAHAQGIVHRDVKPANIMISEEIGTGEHVRILDFGLARLRGHVGRDATQTNVVVGTPNYMAPEQTVGGGTIDARTDIYAVGVVLFEMIAGERPFTADDTLELLAKHRGAPVPALADKIDRTISLPVGLQALIEKAMAKEPGQRFQTAVDLATAIDGILGPRRAGNEERVSPRDRDRTQDDDTSTASTMLDVPSGPVGRPASPPAPNTGSRRWVIVVVAAVLAAVAVSVARRAVDTRDRAPERRGSASVAAAPTPASDAAAPAIAPTAPAVDAPAPAGAPIADAAPADPVVQAPDAPAETAESLDAGFDFIGPGEEIELDPESATNPDPSAETNTAEDEAPDAPATPEEGERKLAAAPMKAATVREAVQMIKDGKRELALASLHALAKKSPHSAYIPFLMGNLYFDKLWWGVAIDHYKTAIKRNAGYKRNAVLNKNVIKMLGSKSTVRKAQGFLRWTVGRSAVPYLRAAAKSHENGKVRRQAAALAKQI